jgi:hypothetical protein
VSLSRCLTLCAVVYIAYDLCECNIHVYVTTHLLSLQVQAVLSVNESFELQAVTMAGAPVSPGEWKVREGGGSQRMTNLPAQRVHSLDIIPLHGLCSCISRHVSSLPVNSAVMLYVSFLLLLLRKRMSSTNSSAQ